MKKIVLTKEQKQIYGLLQFFMRYSNTGVLVFFQEVNYPDDETVFLMKQAQTADRYKAQHGGKLPESVRVSGGSDKPYAESVVEVADSVAHEFRKLGGIENFFAAFEELSKTKSRNMNILRDLSRRAGSLETIADIAEKNYLSDPQITNIKNRTLKALAINISARRASNKFFKQEGNNGGKLSCIFLFLCYFLCFVCLSCRLTTSGNGISTKTWNYL